VVAVALETFNAKICDWEGNMNDLEYFKIQGIFNTWSMSLFAYQCHSNIPDVFVELEKKSIKRMKKVLTYNNIICFVCYSTIGFFGYLTFANDPEQLENGNILQADYKNVIPILVAILSIGL